MCQLIMDKSFFLPQNVPFLDSECWAVFPRQRWVYNKMRLCELQNVEHAPMPVEPKEYPVVLKPIINLYGMGLQSVLVKNFFEFSEQWEHTGFWSTYLTGTHRSYDVVLDNDQVKWCVCFTGFPARVFGAFERWELAVPTPKIPPQLEACVE